MDPLDESSPRRPHDSDGDVRSPAEASNYSSCDGSEFDRYCSANSALGSASICSSVGNYSELLDSLKSSHRWNGFDGFPSGGGVETPRENGQDVILMDGTIPSSRIRTGSRLFRAPMENSSSFKGNSEDIMANFSSGSGSVEGEDSSLDYGSGHGRGNSHSSGGVSSLAKGRTGSKLFLKSIENSSLSVKGKSVENAMNSAIGSGSAEEEIGFSGNLSCEDSGGEDSSIDYGSGDESRIQFAKRSNLQCSKEIVNESGNPLFMNSLVAFGAKDWDEFEQESGADGLGSMSLYEDQLVQKHQSIGHENAPTVIENESDAKILRDSEVSRSRKPISEEKSKGRAKFDYVVGRETASVRSEEVSGFDVAEVSLKQSEDESELTVTPLCNSIFEQSFNALNRAFEGKDTWAEEVDGFSSLLTMVGTGRDMAFESTALGNSDSTDGVGEDLPSDEAKRVDAFDSYNDMVLEMEEILLDSGDSHGTRSTHANGGYTAQHSHHSRDGSSTASTSGTDDVCPLPQYLPNIDQVEVVGAKQKKGDVSFGERLVGVKEYTIYKLQVWSGKDQWEVERRYRDFFALYHQLYTLFTNNGLSLPSPWSRVERESRKIFGNTSPDVISERSILIQDCLQSILNSKFPFGTPSSLVSFLSPGQVVPNSSLLKSLVPQSLHTLGRNQSSNSLSFSSSKDISMLGKTISLVVEIKPRKSMRQLLEAQHYTCAGCHRHLDAGKTLLREIVQTFGWNKLRFCEYTSQVFCASCHTNDTIVLPAKVLHHWDFSLYPVSQLAKAYLESIFGQPMLCVSAVNPFLFSKVPALLHVMGIRKKIGAMLPYVHCPFRKAVQRNLGLRRYLLESNDFFALRDLVDLSKGAFAGPWIKFNRAIFGRLCLPRDLSAYAEPKLSEQEAKRFEITNPFQDYSLQSIKQRETGLTFSFTALPIMVETVSNKILEHITEQCLICYDSGIPCAARQDCDDPASLIFPFQEAEAEKCRSCGSLFHKPCFVKLMGCCPCGKLPGGGRRPTTGPIDLDGVSDRSIQPSGSSLSSGFLSDVLSNARPDKIWKPKNSSPVILMGSLPSTSL